jgi:hypothetical protein
MPFPRFALALLAFIVAAAPAGAVDLGKVERTIGREPVYQGKPAYCLLVFGAEAKTRMWLVVAGDTLYLDRRGSGDLTAAIRYPRSCWNEIYLGTLTDSDGKSQRAFLDVRSLSTGFRLEFEMGDLLQEAGSDRKDRVGFAERPGDAPIIHFAGPLTIAWYRGPPSFAPGQDCEFNTMLGTPGIGKGAFAAVPCCAVPKQARLTAEITFPHRDAGQPLLRKEIRLQDD